MHIGEAATLISKTTAVISGGFIMDCSLQLRSSVTSLESRFLVFIWHVNYWYVNYWYVNYWYVNYWYVNYWYVNYWYVNYWYDN